MNFVVEELSHFQNHKEMGIWVDSMYIFIFASGLNPCCLSFVLFIKIFFQDFPPALPKIKKQYLRLVFPVNFTKLKLLQEYMVPKNY